MEDNERVNGCLEIGLHGFGFTFTSNYEVGHKWLVLVNSTDMRICL